MKMRAFVKPVLIASSLLAACSSAFAEELTIQDTSGFTRSAAEIDGSTQVDFALVNGAGAAADGIAVTLTNATTGEVLTATSINGIASFQGVTAGVWTVATTSAGITFTSVSVVGAVAMGGATLTSTLIGGAAVVGGGTAAAIAITDSNNDDNDELSPAD